MDFLMEWRWMLAPLLACFILSITHVYMGIHVVSRKVIFVDLALAQIAALGATYATTLGYDAHEPADSLVVAVFSLLFTFAGAGLFSIARMRKERVPQEAFIGIVYAAASAAAVLILSKSPTGGEELKHMLVGDILLVSIPTIINDTVLYSLLAVFHISFRRRFLAISKDAEGAQASGINIRLWDLLFYTTFGVMVTRSVAIAGVLLVFSYLVIPAVIAQMWSDTIRGRLFIGWATALSASVTGILWSFASDTPTGPAVVISLAAFLIVSGASYSILKSPARGRAAANVAILLAIGIVFFGTLSMFRKGVATETLSGAAAVDRLLEELKHDEAANQLDAISHLSQMEDKRIVPALADLLSKAKSDQVVETIAETLGRKNDPQAAPALRAALQKDYDPFLKLTLAGALTKLKDKAGYDALLEILKGDQPVLLRSQALELIREESGKDFGYNPEKSGAENQSALDQVARWIHQEIP
ncbi:MAG TPA: iron chelate uptake ABC transporter family permease subunit [Terriglobia bacterium]|nr:iron chelate uptake ABC transporter family permease subunit [Terriglobia bacterium]